MSLNFKNRIAFYYMLATAIIMAIAFAATYFVVSEAVFRNLDSDLSYEAHKHTKEIEIDGDRIKFKNKAEWEEREHREVQVNPVFIQLNDEDGRLMEKSLNLKEDVLAFSKSKFGGHFDSQIGNRAIRQIQLPLEQNGNLVGYIIAAMSSESAKSTLLTLRNVLLLSYLLVLIGLYFVSRFLAGRSISPMQEVTNTIARITKHNLTERVELPPNKDEIYELSTSFNSLLDRIENAIKRERQFTSDASHELRTPLASLRGTLEVLIRKPRTQDEYEEKVKFSLGEIEKMATTLEQLLLLARLDSNSVSDHQKSIPLPAVMDESLGRFKKQITDKSLKIDFHFEQDKKLLVPQFYTNLIIDNLLSNAVKYSNKESKIKITIEEVDSHVVCRIKDHGIGINKEDLKSIYDSFFRSDAMNHKHISGNGLGLSIVKKCTEAIKADLHIESTIGEGTTITITF